MNYFKSIWTILISLKNTHVAKIFCVSSVISSQIQMPSSIEVQAGQTCSFPIESGSDDPESCIVCKFSANGINYKQFYMSEFDEVSNGGYNFSDRLKVQKDSPKKFKMTFTYVTEADQGWYFCVESNNENASKSMHLIVTSRSIWILIISLTFKSY